MPHRPTHDLPEHVAAPFVGRHDPVGDEERHRAQMIRDDAHGHVGRFVDARPVAPTGALADGFEDGREEVRIVVRELALDDRRDALEAHPRVDRRRRQGLQRAVRLAVELHEDVVPHLDEPIAAAIDSAALTSVPLLVARELVAAEVVNLGTSTAGTGVPHRPEVLGEPELCDSIGRDQLRPDAQRFLVSRNARLTLEDRRIEAIGRQLPRGRQEIPGERDRLFLEVVSEREVPEHLEERVVSQRRADVVQVVVLSAHAHALLRRSGSHVGALLTAEERVLELIHPGVREKERWVVGRNERGAGDDGVAVPLEVLEEAASDLT